MSDAPAIASGTVKLPGIGPVKKVYVYVGVGAVGVLAAYIMWKRQGAASDTPVEYTDADLGTGLTTGAGSDAYTGATAGGSGSDTGAGKVMPTTNPEWTAAALEYFNWLEPGYVTGVLGKYLSRVKLSSEEGDFVRQVWAALGKPPEGPSTFELTDDSNAPGGSTNPGQPTDLRVTTTTGSSVSLDWADAPDTTGYEVYRNGNVVGSPSGSSFTDTGLASGTDYVYAVVATNGGKRSAMSGSVTGKTATAATTTPPAAPVEPVIRGLNLSASATTSLRFSWGFSGTTPDRVEVFLNDKPKDNLPGAPVTYTFTGLQKGTKYKVSVRGGKGNIVGPTASSSATTRSK